jgi:hypothetical protein
MAMATLRARPAVACEPCPGSLGAGVLARPRGHVTGRWILERS